MARAPLYSYILPFASVPLLPPLEEEKIKITIRDSSAYKNYIDPDSLQLAIGGRKKKLYVDPLGSIVGSIHVVISSSRGLAWDDIFICAVVNQFP